MADQQATPDAKAQRTRAVLLEQAIEQGTGEALRHGAMAAAYHGELLRNGVSANEAVQLTVGYVNSVLMATVIKSATDEDRKRDGWHP